MGVMKRLTLLAILLSTGTLSLVAAAYQAPAQPQGPRVIDIEKLKDNLYVLTSSTPGDPATFSGGNVAVFITDGGVDARRHEARRLGPGDPRQGQERHRQAGHDDHQHPHPRRSHRQQRLLRRHVEIVAQENTKANMEKMDAFKGEKAKFLPKKTYKDKLTLGSGKDRIDLYYFGAGHTNGDTFVVFPALRVLHTGDMFAWKDAPLLRSRQRRQLRRAAADAAEGRSPASRTSTRSFPATARCRRRRICRSSSASWPICCRTRSTR